MKNITIREYQKSDYPACEELVNQAWKFDQIFRSLNLRKLAKKLYTEGSLVSSNFKIVAEDDYGIAGFIFGLNKNKKKPRGALLFGVKATLDLNFKKMDRAEKRKLVTAITVHSKNRSAADPRKVSEIILFVISERCRGSGIGTELWQVFREYCQNSGIEEIRVETNRDGASGFYEKLGFEFLVNFDSPLHELATPAGQACIYNYEHQRS